jgi:CubicO group peptidase (beta-lactamase class C family)
MRKKCFVILFALLCVCVRVNAENIDEYVKAEMAEQHIPGLSISVVRDGRIVFAKTYGMANVEFNAPATNDTEFAIASMTKSITASAIMLLVQDGKLSLDDTITKFFDDLPESWRTITIRHLLSHTSGIKDHYRDFPFYPPLTINRKLEYTDEEFIKAHTDGGLNFTPGTQFAYSSSGFSLLGLVIKKVTGKPYADFFRERIFTPLGMDHTHVIDLSRIISGRASGYHMHNGALANARYSGQTFLGAADVSVITTGSDLARWEIGLSAGNLWKKKTLDEMWTPAKLTNGIEVASFPQASSGLGFGLGVYEGHPTAAHGGSLETGFSSFMVTLRDRNMSINVLTNNWDASPSRIGFGVAGLIDPSLTPPHRMKEQKDPAPEITERVKSFFSSFLSGNDASNLITPELATRLFPTPKSSVGTPSPVQNISFIRDSDVRGKGIVRHGVGIAAMRHYKAAIMGDNIFLTVYFGQDGKIADYSGY